MQGMSAPLDTGLATIPLDMAPVQRRFRASERPDETIGEVELLSTPTSFLVLGDPGSGKTTTLKRPTLAMFDLIPSQSATDLAFPVVVVCREVNWAETDLPTQIAQRLGADLTKLSAHLEAQPREHVVLVAELMDQLKCLLVVEASTKSATSSGSTLSTPSPASTDT